jgi:toxin secretion/phage lysis holin
MHTLSHTAMGFIGFSFTCMVVDYLTGIIAAIATQTVTSRTMKGGLLHKAVYLLILVLAAVADMLDISGNIGLPLDLSVICATAIIAIECSSILENACAVEPRLADSPIGAIFSKVEPKHGERK